MNKSCSKCYNWRLTKKTSNTYGRRRPTRSTVNSKWKPSTSCIAKYFTLWCSWSRSTRAYWITLRRRRRRSRPSGCLFCNKRTMFASGYMTLSLRTSISMTWSCLPAWPTLMITRRRLCRSSRLLSATHLRRPVSAAIKTSIFTTSSKLQKCWQRTIVKRIRKQGFSRRKRSLWSSIHGSTLQACQSSRWLLRCREAAGLLNKCSAWTAQMVSLRTTTPRSCSVQVQPHLPQAVDETTNTLSWLQALTLREMTWSNRREYRIRLPRRAPLETRLTSWQKRRTSLKSVTRRSKIIKTMKSATPLSSKWTWNLHKEVLLLVTTWWAPPRTLRPLIIPEAQSRLSRQTSPLLPWRTRSNWQQRSWTRATLKKQVFLKKSHR